jgi:tRNA nucleotidyltransferase (CCA-adding enzyme)
MGASFGIYGLRGYGLDIAMPRKEEATGRGHKDFAVYVDPFLGTYKAALRRDFTMNALMEDVLTGKVVDHFGGIEDLHKGVLRHVNSATFVEDPLRVLRAAQFAARFGFSVAEETLELAKTMDLSALASERIMGELEKALLKADTPSVFFREMKKMEQLDIWFPELIREDWDHSLEILDQAAACREQGANPLGFMLSALALAIPEPEKVKPFLGRLTAEVQLKKYVLNMVDLHRRPHQLYLEMAEEKATNVMFDKAVDPRGLLLLSACQQKDALDTPQYRQEMAFLEKRLEIFREIDQRPEVMGADLVQAGLKPGPAFSSILAYAHDLKLSGVEKEEALPLVLARAGEQGLA